MIGVLLKTQLMWFGEVVVVGKNLDINISKKGLASKHRFLDEKA